MHFWGYTVKVVGPIKHAKCQSIKLLGLKLLRNIKRYVRKLGVKRLLRDYNHSLRRFVSRNPTACLMPWWIYTGKFAKSSCHFYMKPNGHIHHGSNISGLERKRARITDTCMLHVGTQITPKLDTKIANLENDCITMSYFQKYLLMHLKHPQYVSLADVINQVSVGWRHVLKCCQNFR